MLCNGWLEQGGAETMIGADLGPDPQRYIERMCGREVHLIQTSAPLWRRAYLDVSRRWDPTISLGDDLEFHIRCLADADRVGFVGQALFCVREHAGNRLSDFSVHDGRLASLLHTRKVIHNMLVTKDRWNATCSANMEAALRSIYAVFLQRMTDAEIAAFDDAAATMCGTSWQGGALGLMAQVRRLGGPNAAARYFGIAMRLRVFARSLCFNVFVARIWKFRFRKMVGWYQMFSLRDEIRSIAILRDKALREPEGARALFVEPNEFHAETIPGFVSLLNAVGLRVTVIHRPTSPVAEALCRLPDAQQPMMFPLTLRAMRRFLRSDVTKQYDFLLFGSGTVAQKFGYYGGVFDYFGLIPNGRSGHAVIEHSSQTLLTRGDRLQSDRVAALREMQLSSVRFPMLAPVDFGVVSPAALSEPVIFAVVGRLEASMRDVAGLFEAVRELMRTGGTMFRIDLIGGATLLDVPEDIRPMFRALGRLSFPRMYDALDQAHYLLPLLDSGTEAHRRYLRHNSTGTRQLCLGFETPMVMDRKFAAAYEFNKATAVSHSPGRLVDGLATARGLAPDDYRGMQVGLRAMKAGITTASVANLQRILGNRAPA